MAPTSVLIAGCGYLGRRAAGRWVRQGVAVSALTRSRQKAAELQADEVTAVLADLAAGSFPELPPITTVLWSVGFDHGAGVAREAVWIDGLRRLLQQLPSDLRRFVYVSSTGVYGQSDGETVDESTTPLPATESGTYCLQAEQLLQDYFRSRPGVLSILRMAGLYGPDRLLRRVADLQSRVPLPGSADNLLNLVHIDDAVAAVEYVAGCESPPLLMNVVNSGTLTRGEYYSALAKLVEAPAPLFDSTRAMLRGGNKRVVSNVREQHAPVFQFDNVITGLTDAVQRSAWG